MDTQNTEGKADKTRSGPATGYATDVVDAALKIAETRETRNASARHAACKVIDSQSLPDWNYDQASLTILADEVRRLRAVLADINAIARLHPDASGREDFETLEVIADKSHNEVAERRAQHES